MSRDDLGSWLEGPQGGLGTSRRSLGLPPEGRGSLASLGRRVVALAIDWAACWAVSIAFFSASSWATLLVFLAENVLLVGFAGHTLGHWLAGMRVRTLVTGRTADGAPDPGPDGIPGPVRGLVRSVLLCLVIPAVVWDAAGRGLHDKAAGTAIVRR